MISIIQPALPWLASVRRSSAMPVGVLSTVDGQAKLRQEKTAPASAYARLGCADAPRVAAALPGTPATLANEQTQHFTKGGLRGPHPWSHPVTT